MADLDASEAWAALAARAEALQLAQEAAELEASTRAMRVELDAMGTSLSGRLAANLRRLGPARSVARRAAVRADSQLARALRARLRASTAPSAGSLIEDRPGGDGDGAGPAARALTDRLAVAAAAVTATPRAPGATDAALEAFIRAVSGLEPPAAAWWSWAVARATYPTEEELDRLVTRVELGGPAGLAAWITADHRTQTRRGTASVRGLHVEPGGVLIDVSHTAGDDLHTGVQRVVREVAERWLQHPEARLFSWDRALTEAALLSEAELAHFLAWRERVGRAAQAPDRAVGVQPDLLVPWSATVLIAELSAEPNRTSRYRALARAGIAARIGLIGHDTIPLTATDTVTPGMSESFAGYLGFVKYVDRVSCNSETTAESFRGFRAVARSQGLAGPEVLAHLLPAEVPHPAEGARRETEELLALDDVPMVLVVGSHEPRKNHVPVLHAAEHLWRQGLAFHLVMIGGSGWRAERFHELVAHLREAGRPIQVLRNQPEDVLFAAYRLARFMVFPSIAEGFGLPVVESLLSGTPVVTSDYGSMAEVAAFGGCLTVDPRDTASIEAAVHRLLTDGAALDALRQQALALRWKSWDEYAVETWQFLVESPSFESPSFETEAR